MKEHVIEYLDNTDAQTLADMTKKYDKQTID